MQDQALEEAPNQLEDEGYVIQEALDEIPEVSFQEAIEALKAAPPIEEKVEPAKLAKGPAKRLAIQLCDQKLRAAGVPRTERRRLLFDRKARIFRFNDLARGLMGLAQ